MLYVRVRAAVVFLTLSVLAPSLLRAKVDEIAACVAPPLVSESEEGSSSAATELEPEASSTPPASSVEPPEEPPREPAPKRPSLAPRDLWRDVKVEAKRYVADSFAVVTAPLHWKAADWQRAGGVALVIAGLMLADESIDQEARQTRSRFTDRVSDATTGFGGGYGVNVALGFLAAGYVFRSSDLRETGREALEAGFITHILGKWVLKPAFGRERPEVSDGETVFRPGTSNDSFPSGHATEAFSVASVIAMRSKGWVLPALAYTAAALVAFDRVNDRVHFASDVAAGAALGTAVGRFIVGRHRRAQENSRPAAEFELVPIPGGLAGRLTF
jgi:membrane-associated phospholipid phosphatase